MTTKGNPMKFWAVVALLVLSMPTNALAQSGENVVTAEERLENGPLFEAPSPQPLGGGLTLLYAYVIYDGLSTTIFGEVTVNERADGEARSAPYLLIDATDTEGDPVETAGGNSIPSVLIGTNRAPFEAIVRTNGYQIAQASVTACTSNRGLRPDLIETTDVLITTTGSGSVSAEFSLTNTSDIDLTQPVTDIAVYREDGLLVGSGYGFYSGTIAPGQRVEESIVGASWDFAVPTDNEPLNVEALTFEPLTYAANAPRSSECTDEPITISFINAPESITDAEE